MEHVDLSRQLRLWSDELRAIANAGLHWSEDNPYHQERFRRVLRIAAELVAAQDTRSAEAIERVFTGDLSHIAPYPTADAAIFNDAGEILLIQRKDDQRWAMPGGFCDVGETPVAGACREAYEETGIEVEPLALVGVYDSRLCGSLSSAHLYQFVFLCRPRNIRAEPIVTIETLDVGWFAEAELPPLSPGHNLRIPDAFRFQRSEFRAAVFDR